MQRMARQGQAEEHGHAGARVTMQTHVKGSRGSGKVRGRDQLRKAQGHHGQGHGQGRSELHTLSDSKI